MNAQAALTCPVNPTTAPAKSLKKADATPTKTQAVDPIPPTRAVTAVTPAPVRLSNGGDDGVVYARPSYGPVRPVGIYGGGYGGGRFAGGFGGGGFGGGMGRGPFGGGGRFRRF